MNWRILNPGATLLLALAFAPPQPGLIAAQKEGQPEEAERKDDQAAVRTRTREFLEAFGGGNAREVAGFWTPGGEYLRGDDLTIRGRSNIEKAYAEYLKKRRPGVVALQGESVRFLSNDTAVQEGVFLVKRPNPAEQTRNRFSILYVREKGQWHFGLLREWPEGPSLQELAWLVGAWTYRTDDGEVRTVFEWTDNKTFLRSRTTPKQTDAKASGFQILALDPAAGAVKSWTFEGDGGLGEGVWARTDKGWTVKSTAVTADGEKVTATNVITPIDENTFTWQSTDRTVDGEKAPDIGPVKVVRERAAK